MSSLSPRGGAAFQHRDFRLYWFGSLINNVGAWMQIVATGWLVLLLTNSAADLGINATLQGVPILFFSLAGGVVADRVDRYKMILTLSSLVIIPDAILAVLVGSGQVRVEHIFVWSFVNGLLNGMASPARQAIVPSLVPRPALLSAMALNGVLWQGSAVIGPSLAGLALAAWGTASNFYIPVGTDVISVCMLLFIRTRSTLLQPTTSAWQNVAEGIRYAWRNGSVRTILLGVAAIGLLGRSYFALMPVFAKDIFDAGPRGLGLLITMPAVGTIIAGFLISLLSGRLALQRWFYVAGIGLAVLLLAFAFSPGLASALAILVGVGFGLTSAATFAQTLLQQAAEEGLRGRIMSLYTACTVAAWRLAALPFGFVAAAWGARAAIAVGAGLLRLVLVPASRYHAPHARLSLRTEPTLD